MWLRVRLTTRHNPLPDKGAADARRADGNAAAIAACIPASRVAGSAEVVVDVVAVPGEVEQQIKSAKWSTVRISKNQS